MIHQDKASSYVEANILKSSTKLMTAAAPLFLYMVLG